MPAQGPRRYPGGCDRSGDIRRRRGNRSPGLRAGVQRDPGTRCNDRYPRGSARVQHQKRLPSSWRDRVYTGNHFAARKKELCIMNWLWLVSYFFGGVFAANAIPHFVAGTMGRAFQSPFAKPPGQGLSSATVNVLWGFFNAVVGYVLVARVGSFDLRATSHILAFGLGALLISIFSARHFGRFHGGNTPARP